MEPDDVLPDEMQVRRPVFFEPLRSFAVSVISNPGDVVCQRVEPDIDDVARVEVNRDAPFEGCPRYAQIRETRQEEVVHHLIFAGDRLDEFGMFIDVVDQAVRIFAHFEEIRFFLLQGNRASAVRAFSVDKLSFRKEGFAGSAVPARILALIDVALVVHLFEHVLDLFLMIVVRRADEFVIRSIHKIPDPSDLRGGLIHESLRFFSGVFRFIFDLLTVFVRPGLEENVVSFHPLIAGDGIRQHDLVGIADMRLARRVGDRSRQIIGPFIAHVPCPPFSARQMGRAFMIEAHYNTNGRRVSTYFSPRPL